jgi:hypothetical protein
MKRDLSGYPGAASISEKLYFKPTLIEPAVVVKKTV